MKFSADHIEELNLLLQFDLSSAATGIKVHKDASEAVREAAERLYNKGLCTLPDGGYLTDEGIEVAEHAERVLRVLSSRLAGFH
ncbi:TIGR02647 family protein [Vibrio sonorensis]|uniref:TIGR02647 family protein n=1 Tax=Vibrio sonorensis TaxID=1004316 RepID=UPI0008DA3189|nr:TIGR02647 family protein [Vibrio sonorensis]